MIQEPQDGDDLQKKMVSKLVEMGYAELTIIDDRKPQDVLVWTPIGDLIRREVQRIYDEVYVRRGDIGQSEAAMILSIFVNTR